MQGDRLSATRKSVDRQLYDGLITKCGVYLEQTAALPLADLAKELKRLEVLGREGAAFIDELLSKGLLRDNSYTSTEDAVVFTRKLGEISREYSRPAATLADAIRRELRILQAKASLMDESITIDPKRLMELAIAAKVSIGSSLSAIRTFELKIPYRQSTFTNS